MNKIIFFSVMTLVISSCSHFQSKNLNSDKNDNSPSSSKIELKGFKLSDIRENSDYLPKGPSIPIEENALVNQWIRYFQGRGRAHMERYLARSTRYGQLMRRILRDNGMPEDLIYIALIESGFSSRAVSHASAVGYWQFIKPTGRRYSLEISPLIDERRDPVLSTQAAAQYFKELYEMFGSWYLAMASYNAGENRILRATQKYRTQDFWELASKRRALPKETVHYVPKFIAAKLIAENPEKYGFTEIEYEAPLEFEVIQLKNPIDIRVLAQSLNMDYDEFKILNPKFKGPLAPLSRNDALEIRVPLGMGERAMAVVESAKIDASMIAGYRSDDIMTHKVGRGETLYSIAKKYRTSVAVIRDLNDLKPKRRLRVGQRIDVPKRLISSTSYSQAETRSNKETDVRPNSDLVVATQSQAQSGAQEEKPQYHVVQRGDTLTGIAEEYDVTIGELVKLNKLKRKSVLPVGLRLKLPVVEALPSAVAEKEGVRRNPATFNKQKSSRRVTLKKNPQQIKIKKVHVVRRGENLQVIAEKYNLSVQRLVLANKLNNPYLIQAGQRIKIPAL
jgi:membrane-bound lytic murein transglycosylase D